MKKFFAMVGLGLLVVPLLWSQLWKRGPIEVEGTGVGALWKLKQAVEQLPVGMMIAFWGLVILGFVMDAGKGYRRNWISVSMVGIGAAWIAFYQHGWMLGIPLIVYPVSKWVGRKDTTKERKTEKRAAAREV